MSLPWDQWFFPACNFEIDQHELYLLWACFLSCRHALGSLWETFRLDWTLLSAEDKRFMGSTPFEFGSANLDANGELGRFRGSPGKK